MKIQPQLADAEKDRKEIDEQAVLFNWIRLEPSLSGKLNRHPQIVMIRCFCYKVYVLNNKLCLIYSQKEVNLIDFWIKR